MKFFILALLFSMNSFSYQLEKENIVNDRTIVVKRSNPDLKKVNFKFSYSRDYKAGDKICKKGLVRLYSVGFDLCPIYPREFVINLFLGCAKRRETCLKSEVAASNQTIDFEREGKIVFKSSLLEEEEYEVSMNHRQCLRVRALNEAAKKNRIVHKKCGKVLVQLR